MNDGIKRRDAYRDGNMYLDIVQHHQRSTISFEQLCPHELNRKYPLMADTVRYSGAPCEQSEERCIKCYTPK
jgi:hypothetical protein